MGKANPQGGPGEGAWSWRCSVHREGPLSKRGESWGRWAGKAQRKKTGSGAGLELTRSHQLPCVLKYRLILISSFPSVQQMCVRIYTRCLGYELQLNMIVFLLLFLLSSSNSQIIWGVQTLLAKFFFTFIFPGLLFHLEMCYPSFVSVVEAYWRKFCNNQENYSFRSHLDCKVAAPFIGCTSWLVMVVVVFSLFFL